jgi:CrcB protein
MGSTLAVAVGGALGSAGRYLVAELFAALGLAAYPWGTLVANVAGCLLIGLIVALTGPDGRLLISPELRLFWVAGICGGFTTFSTFAMQILTFLQTGDSGWAWLYLIDSVVLCLLAVWLGYAAGVWLNRM